MPTDDAMDIDTDKTGGTASTQTLDVEMIDTGVAPNEASSFSRFAFKRKEDYASPAYE